MGSSHFVQMLFMLKDEHHSPTMSALKRARATTLPGDLSGLSDEQKAIESELVSLNGQATNEEIDDVRNGSMSIDQVKAAIAKRASGSKAGRMSRKGRKSRGARASKKSAKGRKSFKKSAKGRKSRR